MAVARDASYGGFHGETPAPGYGRKFAEVGCSDQGSCGGTVAAWAATPTKGGGAPRGERLSQSGISEARRQEGGEAGDGHPRRGAQVAVGGGGLTDGDARKLTIAAGPRDGAVTAWRSLQQGCCGQ